MPASKPVRRSVTLPAQVAKQVDSMAKRHRLSDNRVLVELIEEGIEARKQKERAFSELAERFRASKDPNEIKQLADQMGHFVFGDSGEKLPSLEALVAQITPENRYAEAEWGPDQGKETVEW
jgi:hydroxylamine reductase (hybrid-cluster protein)